jgi:predicted PurR-regulated permease PerM
MERFIKNKWFIFLVYSLIGLAVLYMLQLLRPMIVGVYEFLKAVLAPFLIAMIFSYVLNPVVRILHERKVPRTIAVLLIYAVFVTSVTVVFMNVTPMFLAQLKELNDHLPDLTMKAQSIVEDIHESKMLPESVRVGINNAFEQLENTITKGISSYLNGIGSTIGKMFTAFIVPFLAFYMLKDFHLIKKASMTLVPKDHRKPTVKLLTDIDDALGNYIRGQFLVCIIVGGLAYIGYLIIGMPYPILLASIVAVFNIIPYLGPFFGAAPAIIMASTISLQMVFYVALVNLACQVLEGNVISPQVVGKKLHLHPLLIIFALLVGGEVAGIIGLILAVPLFAVIKVIVHHIYLHYHHPPESTST